MKGSAFTMDVNQIMNSTTLWLVSSIMVIVILIEAVVFGLQAYKTSQKMGIPKSEVISGMRASMITAIGPSFAPVIVLIALMAVLGGPTAWMRMNDIGAARTELAMSAIATGMAGSSLEPGKLSLMGLVFALWGMALNNAGWIVIGGYSAPGLGKAVDYMKKNFDQAWVKLVMAAAALGLFSTLLGNAVIAKGAIKANNLFASVVAFVAMFIIAHVFKGNKRIQEFSLGLSMLIGMYVTVAVF